MLDPLVSSVLNGGGVDGTKSAQGADAAGGIQNMIGGVLQGLLGGAFKAVLGGVLGGL